MRLIPALLAVTVLVPGLASAQVARTLERSTARLARTSLRGEVVAIAGGRLSVWLRPEAKTIVAARGLQQQGFRLDERGALSTRDRAALDALIKQHAPDATPGSTLGVILEGLKAIKATERRHRGQDRLIGSLLQKTAGLKGSREVVLWQSGGATLTYRPDANVLIGYGRGGQRGFFLEGGRLGDSSRRDLREFLASGSN